MKRTLLAGIAVSTLALTGCGSGSEAADEVANTSALTTTPNAPSLNKRGALEVAMGETATVTKNGVLVLEVSNTSLSTEGCGPHRKQPDTITKYMLNATITTGNETSVQWLWPTDFYYVDAAGKVTKNIDVTDTNPCADGTSNSFIRTPTNSSADGRPTLDIPNGTVAIGYQNSTGPEARIEWRLESAAQSSASPASAPSPTTAAVTEPSAGAQESIAFYSAMSPGWGDYYDAIGASYSLATEDEVTSFGGYAIGLCVLKAEGTLASKQVRDSDVVNDFKTEYGITLSKAQARVVLDNFSSTCNG